MIPARRRIKADASALRVIHSAYHQGTMLVQALLAGDMDRAERIANDLQIACAMFRESRPMPKPEFTLGDE